MDYTIKDLPQEERPREKLEEHGASSLTDVELLSIILRTGTQGKNVKELSSEILNSYSLDRIADRPLDELKSFEGVSRVKAGQLIALGELSRRMKREDREELSSFQDVKSRVEDMKFLEEERLRIFCLSSGNEVLSEKQLDGGVDSVRFEPREIFSAGLKSNAAAIVLAHNHPSGKSEPTEEDLDVTGEIVELGSRLGIEVLDHVIVGKTVSSLRASEPEIFSN